MSPEIRTDVIIASRLLGIVLCKLATPKAAFLNAVFPPSLMAQDVSAHVCLGEFDLIFLIDTHETKRVIAFVNALRQLKGIATTHTIFSFPLATDYHSCFISYSHEDKPFAMRLHQALVSHGVHCWFDEHDMMPGGDLGEQVHKAIGDCDKMLLCCSEASLASWWVDNEISIAFDKERRITKQQKKKITVLVPLDLDGFLFCGWQSGKSVEVKNRSAADFRGWESDNAVFDGAMEKLLKALKAGT